jgi:uncharacterized membrane protein YdfJ with MMPL/SSD domain
VLAKLADAGIARPRRVAALVLLVFLVTAAWGGPAPGQLDAPRGFDDPGSQATAAREQIERATGRTADAEVLALVRAPRARGDVARVAATLRRDPAVAGVVTPPSTGRSPLVSRDGRETLVAARLHAGASTGDAVARLRDGFARNHAVALGGNAVAQEQVGEQATHDLAIAELVAFPLLALLSLAIFRGVAALLPLAVGTISVLSTFAVLRTVDLGFELSPFALNLVIGLGLGLAVDYSLLCVSRFREELGRGAAVPEAVRMTMATAGRTVVFSAVTVAAAMACLTVFPQRFLISMGIGGVAVALVAAAVTLVVLPALFVLLGARLGRVVPGPAHEGRWYRLAHAVIRRPAASALAAGALMLLLALPATAIRWTGVDATVLPHGQSARVVADAVARDFPSADASPLTLAVSAPSTAGGALERYRRDLGRVADVRAVSPPRHLGRGTWQIDVQARGTPSSEAAQRAVDAVRAAPAPYPVAVGGSAADLRDQHAAVAHALPVALILLVGLTLAALWLMTGSIVLPLKALAMNLLTAVAATGLLVLVFQDGHGAGLLGATQQAGIEQTDFLVLLAIVLGLSTDYGVFLLTRIKEARDRGVPDAEAIAVGLQRTGAIVTAAAVLLTVALGAFATAQLVFLKELGVGAAVAVLLDAFVVRAVLVPALMALLRGANWWSPRPLRRLHARLSLKAA